MNSICLSTDHVAAALSVLGLDVAKASVQAELRSSGNKVRFGFDNNAKGFAQLARVLQEQSAPKIWAGLEATGSYSQALALWLHGQGHRVSLLRGNRPLWKWRSSEPWRVAVKNSPSCCRPKKTAWKESLPMCVLL